MTACSPCLAYLPLRLLDCFGFGAPVPPSPPPFLLLTSACVEGTALALTPTAAAGGDIGTGIAGALFASYFALALSLDSFDFPLDYPRRGGAGASTGAGTGWG